MNNSGIRREPAKGFEPLTCCLRNSCSAPELRWRGGANGGRLRRPPVVYRIAAARVKRRRVPLRKPGRLPRFPTGCIMVLRQQWPHVS